jgi:hypothetical protein
MSKRKRDHAENDRPESPESPQSGFECRNCGCRHFEVYYTRPRDGYIVRSRFCRNCGRRIITRERVIGTK